MALPKISEARSLNDQELNEEIIAIKKQLFQLRLQKATKQLEKPHKFRHAKHRLAQLLSVEHERKLAAATAVPE
jgi:large subunit ribosomal protein L29